MIDGWPDGAGPRRAARGAGSTGQQDGVAAGLASRPTRSDQSTSGICKGNRAQSRARYQTGLPPARSAIDTLAGNTPTNSAAPAGLPKARPAGCASNPAQTSSAAPLMATSSALRGSLRGTIATNGSGPDEVQHARRHQQRDEEEPDPTRGEHPPIVHGERRAHCWCVRRLPTPRTECSAPVPPGRRPGSTTPSRRSHRVPPGTPHAAPAHDRRRITVVGICEPAGTADSGRWALSCSGS